MNTQVIGYVGENGTRDVQIPVGHLIEKWPDLSPSILMVPVGGADDDAYPVDSELVGSDLVWHVSAADTAAIGTTKASVRMTAADGRVALDEPFTVIVSQNVSAGGTPPSPIQPWIDKLAELAPRAEKAADDAAKAANRANDAAQNWENGTAANASKLGDKAPEYYLTPVNLLDNSWFGGRYVNGVKEGLVYQAGLNGLHGTTKYPMDRWISWNADVAFADGYITPGSPIVQRVDLNRIDASKTYTAAICLDDGTIKYASGTPSSDFGSYGLGVYASAISGSTWVIGVNAGINVCWAALYEGKYTAETLPPYVPKQYTVELAECQRYYRRVEHTSNMVLFPAIAYNTKSLYGTLPFGFRVKPTIKINNIVFCKAGISTAKAVVSIVSTVTSGGITPIVLTANDGDATTGDTYNIWTSTNGGYMELSADL